MSKITDKSLFKVFSDILKESKINKSILEIPFTVSLSNGIYVHEKHLERIKDLISGYKFERYFTGEDLGKYENSDKMIQGLYETFLNSTTIASSQRRLDMMIYDARPIADIPDIQVLLGEDRIRAYERMMLAIYCIEKENELFDDDSTFYKKYDSGLCVTKSMFTYDPSIKIKYYRYLDISDTTNIDNDNFVINDLVDRRIKNLTFKKHYLDAVSNDENIYEMYARLNSGKDEKVSTKLVLNNMIDVMAHNVTLIENGYNVNIKNILYNITTFLCEYNKCVNLALKAETKEMKAKGFNNYNKIIVPTVTNYTYYINDIVVYLYDTYKDISTDFEKLKCLNEIIVTLKLISGVYNQKIKDNVIKEFEKFLGEVCFGMYKVFEYLTVKQMENVFNVIAHIDFRSLGEYEIKFSEKYKGKRSELLSELEISKNLLVTQLSTDVEVDLDGNILYNSIENLMNEYNTKISDDVKEISKLCTEI